MKKLIVLVFLLVPTLLIAQEFQAGIRGGFNLGNYQGEDNGGNYKFAAYAGGMLTYRLSDITSLQTEINYSMQGFRDHVNGESVTIDLDYITVPLLIQFKLRNFQQFKFVFGPQLGFLIRSNEDPEDLYLPVVNDEISGDTFEDFDYGAVVGMEYEINDQFCIQARYYHGINKLFNEDKVNSDAKNSAFSLGLAVRL
ncbi:porin family protein [Marinifilum sp. D714]|uniref:porin family protein n=1 Tax=Marinifilum sp. D714 TaxID=2937523 RepID=UPI0027C673A8|nr:porin family protein [Marinifilum sp. D714]MDQ2180097.1 PorT family protein [Marinifilum sp. D714]